MKVKSDINAIAPLFKHLIDGCHLLSRNVLKEEKLTLSEYYTLYLIKTDPRVKMRDVKKNLYVSGAYATGIIDKLAKKGFIRRCRREDDRRVIAVNLTDSGEKLIRKLDRKKEQFYLIFLSGMNNKDREIMRSGLLLFISSLKRVLKIKDY